jgi:hypothetical protein
MFSAGCIHDRGPERMIFQQAGDLLAEDLAKEAATSTLSAAFVPSMIFPGKERMMKNLRRGTGSDPTCCSRKRSDAEAPAETGFAPDA